MFSRIQIINHFPEISAGFADLNTLSKKIINITFGKTKINEITAALGISILATILLSPQQKIISIGFLWRRFKIAFNLKVFLKMLLKKHLIQV